MKNTLIATVALAAQAVSAAIIKREATSSTKNVVFVTETDYTTVPPPPKPTKTVQVTVTQYTTVLPSPVGTSPSNSSAESTAASVPLGTAPATTTPFNPSSAISDAGSSYPFRNHTECAANVTGQPSTTIAFSESPIALLPTSATSTVATSSQVGSSSTWSAGFVWPSAPASTQPAVTPIALPAPSAPAAAPSEPPSAPAPTPVPSTIAPSAPASTPPPAVPTSPPSDPPTPPSAAPTMVSSSKTPEIIVVPVTTAHAAKRDVEEGVYTVLPHADTVDQRSNIFVSPRLAGYRNGVNPALHDHADTHPVERRARPSPSDDSPNSLFTPKPTGAPRGSPPPHVTPGRTANDAKPSAPTTSKLASSTNGTNSGEIVKTVVVSEDPRCPYPYPGIHCGKPTTTLTTETQKATEMESNKATKTAWCPYPYPGGHGQMC